MDKNTKWRLILGKTGQEDGGESNTLSAEYQAVDESLEFLYGDEARSGFSPSSPQVNRWLGDIRRYFSRDVVEILQRDAYERLQLRQLLLEPELIETLEHNVDLVANLLTLNKHMPEETRATARLVIRRIIKRVEKRLHRKLKQRMGSLKNRRYKNRRPRLHEINWDETIRRNLKHYQPSLKKLIPQSFHGYVRSDLSLQHVFILVDQSASMSNSVVYSGILGSVLAGIRSLHTRLFLFDTEVADMTPYLQDPIDFLLASQLGGGTDIANALRFAKTHIRQPNKTWVICITDLEESGKEEGVLTEAADIRQRGAEISVILALSDEGKPVYNRSLAEKLAATGVSCFACTPDRFPDVLLDRINGASLMKHHGSSLA